MEKKLYEASRGNRVSEVKQILSNSELRINWCDEDGLTALHTACFHDRAEVAEILLKHPGIDVNFLTDLGSTPLLVSSFFGTLSTLRLLLQDSRVQIEAPDKKGCTALWQAVFKGRLIEVKWIMAVRGHEVNLEAKGRHHNGKYYSVREVAEVSGVSEIVRLLDVSKIDEIRAGLIETGATPADFEVRHQEPLTMQQFFETLE